MVLSQTLKHIRKQTEDHNPKTATSLFPSNNKMEPKHVLENKHPNISFDTLVGHSCRILLSDNSCRTDTLVKHSCGALVGHKRLSIPLP